MAEIANDSYEKVQEQFQKINIDTPELDKRVADIRAASDRAKAQSEQEQYARQMDRTTATNALSGLNVPPEYLDFQLVDKPTQWNDKDQIPVDSNTFSVDGKSGNEQGRNTETSTSQSVDLKTNNGQITEATINGKPANPEEIKNMFGKIAKMFGLEKWFTKFFEAFWGIDQKDTQAMKDALGKITNKTEFKETLAKYNPKVGETGKWETTLQFAEPAKVTGEKTTQKADGAKENPNAETVKVEDGKIILADGAKINQVTEKDGKLQISVLEKNWSETSYMVEWAKPAENPASATA